VNPLYKFFQGICLCCALIMPVQAQDAGLHRHPPQDQLLHEKFYSTWHMPDNPTASCCNNADCYPTEIKYVDGHDLRKTPRGRKIHSHSTGKGRAEQRQSRW